MRALINRIQVGAFFAVHFDIDEQLVHHFRRGFVLKTFVRHHMTPVAGSIADGKKDRQLFLLRAAQRLRPPREPVHRVVLVLQQIRAGFVGEAVGHDGFLGMQSTPVGPMPPRT